MSEHDVVDVVEPVYVGKFVAHLIRIDNEALRMTSCGIHIAQGEELDERAAWPHLAVCARCVKARKAHAAAAR